MGTTIQKMMQSMSQRARGASRLMARAPSEAKNLALREMAALLRQHRTEIQAENSKDVAAAEAELGAAKIDRL